MNRIVGVAILALALGAAACGSSGNNNGNGNGNGGALTSTLGCNIPSASSCFLYSYAFTSADTSAENAACTKGGGSPVATCPAGEVGTCTYVGTGTQAGWSIKLLFYPPMTSTQGYTACQGMSGTWSGGYCPSNYPLDCSNGHCCGAGYPYNCPALGKCYQTPTAAANACGSAYATCY